MVTSVLLFSRFLASTFLLCPHIVEDPGDLSGDFYKAVIPFLRIPHSCLSTSPRPHLLISSSLGVRISVYEFRNTQKNIQSIAISLTDSFIIFWKHFPKSIRIPEKANKYILFMKAGWDKLLKAPLSQYLMQVIEFSIHCIR